MVATVQYAGCVREIINNNMFAPVVECELSEYNWLFLLLFV